MELDGRTVELIGAAVLSGAYSALARQMPEAEHGLMRMYEKHHGRVGALCGEVLAGAVHRAAPRQ